MAKIGFIGLGTMGFPMAGHLAKSGRKVTVFNRSQNKSEGWQQQHDGNAATTPAQAAKDADFVFICVGNDNDVRSVVNGPEGVFASMKGAAVLIDHTTASATLARELSQQAIGAGCSFLDAPVSGGQAGAENGVLTIMCGGEVAAVEQVKPIMPAYSNFCKLTGPSGSGQLTKRLNTLLIAGLVQGLDAGRNYDQSPA